MKDENPSRYLGYLQQCLSSNKKPLGIFLGAGCPVAVKDGTDGQSPLIPDIAGISKLVSDDLAECEECGPLLKIVENHFQRDARQSTTVEDVLTHIRALRAVAGNDDVRGLSAEQLDKLDDKICQLIHQVVNRELPNTETPYHHIASWVDAVRRDNPIEIFTTNYDLLMEQAFEDCCVPYFDGFAGVRKPFFDLRAMEEDNLPPRWARLWKLHGSINWYQVPDRGVFRGTALENVGSKRVIHPSHLKYHESRRMPYLAMIDRLRAFLKQPTATLILCGYSFRDEHINEVIVQGLQSTQTAVAFALIYDDIVQYPQAVSLARKRANLNILARDGAVISGQESSWPQMEESLLPSENGKWVKWSCIDSADESGKLEAKFLLGDFAIFGQFLEELVGTVGQSREFANV